MSFADSSGAAKAIQQVEKMAAEFAKALFDGNSPSTDGKLQLVFRNLRTAIGTARAHGIVERDVHLAVAEAIRDTAPPRELEDPV